MTIGQVLKIIVAAGTIAAGAVSVISPERAGRFTGLTLESARGISEVRAVLGGLFIGLGVAVLVFRTVAAYRTLGIGYLAIAAVRAASIHFDQAPTGSNWMSLAFELVFGVILLI